MIWRLLVSDKLRVSMGDLDHWTIEDVCVAHDLLDAIAAAESETK